MFQLKVLSEDAVPAALERAVRYRVLNEPMEAESICRDILEIEPQNQEAIVTLILALTDQFPDHLGKKAPPADLLIDRLESDYERAYYSGIICERRAKACFRRRAPRSGYVTYGWLRRAMEFYEAAEAIHPEGNDESILRWNTCARVIMEHAEIRPSPDEEAGPEMLE